MSSDEKWSIAVISGLAQTNPHIPALMELKIVYAVLWTIIFHPTDPLPSGAALQAYRDFMATSMTNVQKNLRIVVRIIWTLSFQSQFANFAVSFITFIYLEKNELFAHCQKS